MTKRIITITHPDGTKKIVVSKESIFKPISSNNIPKETSRNQEERRRAKPIMGKAGMTSTKTAYKFGGKINVRKR